MPSAASTTFGRVIVDLHQFQVDRVLRESDDTLSYTASWFLLRIPAGKHGRAEFRYSMMSCQKSLTMEKATKSLLPTNIVDEREIHHDKDNAPELPMVQHYPSSVP